MSIKTTAAFSLSVLAAVISSLTQAQQGSGVASSNECLSGSCIEEVIVSASKRKERLQDVTGSVDAVTGDTIEKMNFKSFSDIQQMAPGLNLASQEPNVNSVTMRGVGFNPNSSTSPTVDVYFNETPIDTNSAFKALYDVGQIEVLRGPQGTLRGKTSPSGAITIATRKANLSEMDGYVQQTFTTENGTNSQGAVSLPLIEDVLAVRIAGLYDKNEGLGTHNVSNGIDDEEKTESARINVIYNATDRISADLTYQYMDTSNISTPMLFTYEGATTDPILEPSDRTGKSTKPGRFDYRGHLTTLGVSVDLDTMVLDYIGGYKDVTQGRETDLAYGGAIPNYSQDQAFTNSSKQFSNELRLTSVDRDFWNFLFGVYAEDSEGDTLLTQKQVLPWGFVAGANPPLDIAVLDIGVVIPNESQTYAVFTDHRFQISEKGLIQVGLRYQETDVKRDFVQSVSGGVIGPVPIVSSAISPENRNVTYDQTTGSLSYRYSFNSDMTGYLTYGSSYRAGGVVSTTADLDEDLIVFDAETSDSFELGLKGLLFGGSTFYTVAVYQQEFKDYLAYTGSYLSVSTTKDGVVDNNAAFTFNADARVTGLEANLQSQLTDRLSAGLSFSINDSKFLNALAPCNDYNGDGVADTDGEPSVPVGENVAHCQLSGRISDQAKWSLSFNAEYTVPLSSGDLFARTLLSYAPSRKDPFAGTRFDDLFSNNIFFGYRGPNNGYEISVYGKNLGDDATLTTRNAAQVDYNVFDTGYSVGTAVRPREFGVILTARF